MKLVHKTESRVSMICDYGGLILIGLLSFGYFLSAERFAKINIYFSELGFPIFTGEIVFLLCFVLFLSKYIVQRRMVFRHEHYLTMAFVLFIFIKSLWGYFFWGPLVFRHAALFYYSFFALFAYAFYQRSYFNGTTITILLIFLLSVLRLFSFYQYYLLTCCLLCFIIIFAYPKVFIRYFLFIILILAIPYNLFFRSSRTFIVANFSSLAFIILIVSFFKILKFRFRIIIVTLSLLFIFLGGIFWLDTNQLYSILNIKQLYKSYKIQDNVIKSRVNTFVPKSIVPKICNPNELSSIVIDTRYSFGIPLSKTAGVIHEGQKNEINYTESNPGTSSTGNEVRSQGDQIHSASISYKKVRLRQILPVKISGNNQTVPSPRELVNCYGNSMFRIFIWKDLIRQIVEGRPFFGFDFGFPFRSRNLEISNWATGEWERDGWICIHNSYFDIIYRAGVIGIIFIITIFSILISMIRRSVFLKSKTGILLCAILINWLVGANFLEILEFPYTAIPFWSIFGLTYAFLFKGKYESSCNP